VTGGRRPGTGPGGRRRTAFLVGGAVVQFVTWLLLRPDLAGSAGDGTVLLWLGSEAVLAVLLGLACADESLAVRTVLAGWTLQMAHYAAVVDKTEYNLWGVGLFFQVALALVATVLARLAARLTARRRARGAR
jgi:hypothetical protein